jgi:tetratricopeptide (TPR) repeat protein
VELFVQSARHVQRDLGWTEEGKRGVVSICRLVQGMPLGILLAAAWSDVLAPSEIAGRISGGMGGSLDFLAADMRDLPERQRSMRAAFDHSWRLLGEKERAVFRQVSVFRGGFSREAAREVAGASLGTLRALVAKSLLRWDLGERFEIHELLRQYGADRLRQSDQMRRAERSGAAAAQGGAVRDRHCAYYARFLQQREGQLTGRGQRTALAEIGVEIDNIRAAWTWALDQGRIKEIDRCLESLAEFYRVRAWFQEGEEAFARAAQRLAGEQVAVEDRRTRIALGQVLLWQGRFGYSLGLKEKADQLLQASLAVCRDLGAHREAAYAICYLGGYGTLYGGLEKEPFVEALSIFQETGDQKGIAVCHVGLAWSALHRGDYVRAKQCFQDGLATFRQVDNREGISYSLDGLGYTHWILGEYREAKQLHQEMLAMSRQTGDQAGIARSLGNLGQDASGLGELEESGQFLEESLALYREISHPHGVREALGDWAELANMMGEHEKAARLAREAITVLRSPPTDGWSLRVLGNAACALGDLQEAREYLHQALELTLMAKRSDHALLVLVGIAALLAAKGEKERALELLALILHHPQSWQWTKDRAAPLVAQLEAELAPEVVAAAQARGRALDLDTAAAELLVELAD